MIFEKIFDSFSWLLGIDREPLPLFCTFDISFPFSFFRCYICLLASSNYFSAKALCYLSFYKSFFRVVISSDYDFFFCMEGDLVSTRSKIARFALFANCKVEKVSAEADIDGLMQIMNRILPCPSKESLRILVNLEFLKGIWVRDLSISAEIQWPKHERLPLMLVNSWILISFSAAVKSEGILNFSLPARSTIRSWITKNLLKKRWLNPLHVFPCKFERWSEIENSLHWPESNQSPYSA